jgi:phosphoadenosine phosphosulfate reductase
MSGTVADVERDVTELLGTTDVELLSAGEVIDAALEHLPSVALACSFQKEESVLVDMLLEREPKARIFTLDTHVLFPESYELWRDLERRYGIRLEVYEGPSLGRQAATHGEALWER